MNLSATALVLLSLCAAPAVAAEDFKPLLQKVVVNEQTLYEAGSKVAGRVQIDGAKPAKIVCTFVNKGDKPAEDPFMVLLHAGIGENVLSSDLSPSMPTTRWEKDKEIVEGKFVDLSSFTGKDIELFIGLYRGADRFSLVNEGMDYQQRLPAGVLSVREVKTPAKTPAKR